MHKLGSDQWFNLHVLYTQLLHENSSTTWYLIFHFNKGLHYDKAEPRTKGSHNLLSWYGRAWLVGDRAWGLVALGLAMLMRVRLHVTHVYDYTQS